MGSITGYDLVVALAQHIRNDGGRALIVGGYARDETLKNAGIEVPAGKDIDLEVFGLSSDALVAILSQYGDVKTVGESFAVWKIGDLDVSIPRRDSKTGPGHKGFRIDDDPTMTFAEAARRRDLTINALALDPLTGELLDAWGGTEDIHNGVLRATDLVLFGDDPLRALRLAQFAGRFGFSIDPKTLEIARTLPLEELPRERIGEEWKKLLLRSVKPSVGLTAMHETRVIEKLHPELATLIETPQDPEWHPEGSVWNHTLLAVDVAAKITRREQYDEETALLILLATLCHDLGKPETTAFENGRLRSLGHSESGEGPTRSFFEKLAISNDLTERTVKLVREHLWVTLNVDGTRRKVTASNSAIRRLALRLHPATIQELVSVAEADRRGRLDADQRFPEGQILLDRASSLEVVVDQPKPLLLGRHLINMGLTPSPMFGVILRQVFEAQIEGNIQKLEEAEQMARDLIDNLGKEVEDEL